MSGGEQTRASLARLVIADPDLLLLDEPTNHLDIDALEWLEVHLQRRSGSLLVASHDRAFLDATVTRVWELRDRRLTAFRGDYSAYHRQRQERDERASKESETHAEQVAREKELVQRYRSHRKFSKCTSTRRGSRSSRRINARRRGPDAGSRCRARRSPAIPRAAQARSSSASRRPWSAICRDAARTTSTAGPRPSQRWWRAPIPRRPARRADRDRRSERGRKTTLLRTIAGELPPLDGAISFGHNTQLGYLAQLRGSAIPGATVLDALLQAIPVTPGEARGYLARFLFRGDDVFKEVHQLSGGERSRLELALLGIQASNLLLLDEPTNHLDIAAREAIEGFLVESSATLLIVSHDRRLLETVCDRLWVVSDGLAVPFDGGYRAWRAALGDGWTTTAAAEAEARRLRVGAAAPVGGRSAAVAAAGPAATATIAKPAGRPRAARRDKLSKDAYRRQKASVEAELTRLGLRKNHLELSLGDPAVAANFVEVRRISSELADVERALAAAEDAWLEVEERAP